MSMSLLLSAVSEEQASALRSGRISANDLLTSHEVMHVGSGDVTHLGCGCVLTLCALLFVVLPLWRLFGWEAAVAIAVVSQAFVLTYTWQLWRSSRRAVDVDSFDPLLMLSDESELCLYDWHGLHFLLTGSDWKGETPDNFLLHGGDSLPTRDEDSEYGPPRIIASTLLEPILERLESLSLVGAAARLEEANVDLTIHPGRFAQDSIEGEWRQLTAFISRAVQRKASVLIEMG